MLCEVLQLIFHCFCELNDFEMSFNLLFVVDLKCMNVSCVSITMNVIWFCDDVFVDAFTIS